MLVGWVLMASITTTAAIQSLSVQCYGDSLTAGFKSDEPFHPYAIALEEALKRAGISELEIQHKGMPGWTAKELVEENNSPESLDYILQQATKPVDIAIILAGTNDLAYGFRGQDIAANIWRIHEIAHNHNVATIAVSIPESRYQSMDPKVARLRGQVNELLRDSCSAASGRCVFVDCPVRWGDESLWEHDGLHFSASGYDLLGSTLAPIVLSLQASITKTQQHVAALSPGSRSEESASSPHLSAKVQKKHGGRVNKFPAHWGDPPRSQTRDMRVWPGGYGMGSGTVAKWIQQNMDRDAAAGSADEKVVADL